ncbi:hypothetical protein BGZ63DRAFT_427661 [Mariannaea sp. PMI_226]|nr:hypothetical protein BGZ63DRAFT_427661 [Mariannaea sp. PMI_226]
MVQEAIREPNVKKVHPFFTKAPPDEASGPETDLEGSPSQTDVKSTKTQKKRRKADQPPIEDESGQNKKARHSERGSSPAVPANLDHHTNNLNQGTPSDEHPVSDFPTPPLSDISTKPSDQTLQLATNPAPKGQPSSEHACETPFRPKKVLKWNPKTGTLGSPPKPKPKNNPSRIVCIKYGRDDVNRKEMGNKIAQILDGNVLFPATPTQPRTKREPKKPKTTGSTQDSGPKTTHPFFSGKAKTGQTATSGPSDNIRQTQPVPTKHSVFMSTPISPRKPRNNLSMTKATQFGIKSRGPKFAGALHPLWPAKDMSHVRGLDSFTCATCLSETTDPPKKSKGYVVTIPPSESILARHCAALDLNMVRESLPKDDGTFEPVPEELRVPTRYFESGPKLQKRIRSQLRTYKPMYANVQGLGEPTNSQKRTHLAVVKLYDALEMTLSAYDRSTCESQTWMHKYAPTNALQVLQAGKEAILLKDWLQTLRIQSVDTGAADTGGKAKSKESAPRKKRKKDRLDGFIVDSEEEANYMDEISEDDDDWAPAGSGLRKKTVIRSGDAAARGSKDQKRLTNAVVISGPHGSGKTAAVYAVAKELGFEIFEINSSSRRSGKDLLDRVGDMTRNHLVQQHHADSADEVKSENGDDDEVARDLISGKQGMMTTFFKPKPTATAKKPIKKVKDRQDESDKQVSPKNQKQSLILLEEVDVLYEEDKQFWATLMNMIAQSKRPFIMTCNDESLVPLQSLNLHGIFRFSPPPVDLAVDLCLLVAANEGHVLQRPAVDALYKSRNNDLRATLTELNYWCQIGVGDRRGGFDWFVLRWPKGCDLDENGDVIRVVSGDTYRKGMGWISRDPIATNGNPLMAEGEAMQQSWLNWDYDLGDWCSSVDMSSWAAGISHTVGNAKQKFDTLAAYDEFCDAMSSADLLARGSFGTGLQEQFDMTVPEMSTKSRDDFILGRALLQTDSRTAPCAPHRDISMSVKSLARHELLRAASTFDPTGPNQVLSPVNEDRATSMLNAYMEQTLHQMTRIDLAFAFDPIAVSAKAAPSAHLDPSVFDRTLKLIVLDVAPWVRGIVESDDQLMQERIKLSNLLSEGGKRKRMRTTRSAYSALEGGERRATRRESYFGDCLNTEFVRRTAGEEWRHAVAVIRKPDETTESIPSSPPASEEELEGE